jgi:xylan 1,4-beta-xylosidase
MGSPQNPSPQQYAQLEKAGQLNPGDPPEMVQVKDSAAVLRLMLPRQAVSLLVFEW